MKRMSLLEGTSCAAFRGILLLLAVAQFTARSASPGGLDAANPPPPPAGALGFPSRAADLDILPGFRSPPPGYGEVPFWWWTGDKLEPERLLWQLDELHRKGIAGVQVNYAHEDSDGWPTYPSDPPIFSDEWWKVWKFVAAECGKRNMGIGLSGYTLDWPNGRSLVSRTIYSDPEITGRELGVASRTRISGGKSVRMDFPPETVAVRVYPWKDGRVGAQGVEVPVGKGARAAEWVQSQGEWEVWVYTAAAKAGSLNPMHPESGRRVIEKFFQPFQDHAADRSAKGLNYFFQDELQFGVGDHVWTEDFADQFRARKGYDVFEALPALFSDIGPRTIKARLDYLDVRMQLIQERYFEPIFRWHWDRGLVYGCDAGSRGRDPVEFGDYFSAVRWYTAPGHDTPGGHADLIKGKVSSSIAQLYRRPRVWLEGYHSLGWGAAPERLMQATCENYLYGCNLLNLHGFYYSTHGSFWEWAPPCYHFRMPYWEHMGVFLKYFERLSYVLSQGVHQCDIAVLYPVTPGQAGLGGKEAPDIAWDLGEKLFKGGRDFIYIDDDSVARATIEGGRLHVSDASYRVLVLPGMRAMRWSTLQKARTFQESGGMVIAVGGLPEASDRAGRDDAELDGVVRDLFGVTAAEARGGRTVAPRTRPDGGVGAVLPAGAGLAEALEGVLKPLPLEVEAAVPVQAQHRRIGIRDVYWVMGAPKGTEITFRATGRVESWNPWTGEVQPILTATRVGQATRVKLPSGEPEAQLIVFTPGDPGQSVSRSDLDELLEVKDIGGHWEAKGFAASTGRKSAVVEHAGRTSELHGESVPARSMILDGDWEFELIPTMDNRWGDFRLPATNPMIGAEGRIFRYAEENGTGQGWQDPGFDDSRWARVTHGFGGKFRELGPFPAGADTSALESRLAGLKGRDLADAIEVGGRTYPWSTYSFSWRWGLEGDPGHQGWHGLKENVTDEFLCLGKPVWGMNENLYREEAGGTRYYLWTTVFARSATKATAEAGGLVPTAIYLDGKPVTTGTTWELAAGPNPLLLRYDGPGRGHFVVLEAEGRAPGSARTPLAMKWWDDPRVLPFDIRPDERRPAGWYRFTAPPGLKAMTVTALGDVEVWVDGRPCKVEVIVMGALRVARVEVPEARPHAAKVAVRVVQERGAYAGGAIPDPILLDCGSGLRSTGDWSEGSVMENYSGGARYRRDVTLESVPAGARVQLDLGDVVATAEVRINGENIGVRVAPPWVFDLTPAARPGTNRLEVTVYNTLANHYLTIPTKYRGSLKSGLVGPVKLSVQAPVVLRE